MSKLFAFAVFLAAAGYLAYQYQRPTQPPPLPAEPPAAEAPRDPTPVFSDAEIAKVRQSLQDGDPSVRWAAAQLLYSIHDPQLGGLMEKMIAEDPDPDLRIKIVGLMKGREDLVRLGGLVKGLSDVDKNVRIASLNALGDIGDPSVVTWVTALLKDPEPDVRIAALQTLGRFQDKRRAEFEALSDKLKKDYEEALRHAAARR
ncbi:MAG TPA: HEAT repeat domain-containing protein [Elusimicrobiota bacterium]|jgi:HEAT repeat protein|nr:HEAT repeat domain-containing protein [Elusimicrobiota bacterium]